MKRGAAARNVLSHIVLAATLVGCTRMEGGSTVAAAPSGLPQEGRIAAVPLGDIAGVASSTLASTISNPYHGQPEAIEQGKRLFRQMNCAGCHGYTVEGAMGPDLTDQYWRYGGTPVEIYKSIYEGRPQGMPAWGQALPAGDVWKIVAYVESLGGSFPADSYQPSREGDRAKMNVAPEVSAKPMHRNEAAPESRADGPAASQASGAARSQATDASRNGETSTSSAPGARNPGEAMPTR